MTVVFLLLVALLVHTYAGYPLSLLLLRALRGSRAHHKVDDVTPSISLIISAYNEAGIIRKKIENAVALDYPAGRLRIIVVSDGSTDATEAIVREFGSRGVVLRAFEGRRGKVACLNDVIPDLTGDLVVMSDANSIYEAGSLRRLVRHFADPRVGCVCGRLRYVNPRRLAAGEGERAYWGYEGIVKKLESDLGALLGSNGAMYAYRRELFRPVDPLMFCDDVIPIRIALAGFLTLYDPEAVCEEESVEERVEVRRRRRHASFGMRSFLTLAGEAARAGRPLVVYQCVSHRILRWLGGPLLLAVLATSFFLPAPWAGRALLLQGLFYGSAALGRVLARAGLRVQPVYLPYYFLVITAAGTAGLVAFLTGRDVPFWEPRR